MQKLHSTLKASLLCLSLGIVAMAGTVTPNLFRTTHTPSSVPRLVTGDGQETHGGGGKRTGAMRLVAGDGQETHGGGKRTA